eukprot:scaffold1315_cov217-Chaetoceros_neogracile.AAC.3
MPSWSWVTYFNNNRWWICERRIAELQTIHNEPIAQAYQDFKLTTRVLFGRPSFIYGMMLRKGAPAKFL